MGSVMDAPVIGFTDLLFSVIVMRLTEPSDKGPAGLNALVMPNTLAVVLEAPLEGAPLHRVLPLVHTPPFSMVLVMAAPIGAVGSIIAQNKIVQLPGVLLLLRAGSAPRVNVTSAALSAAGVLTPHALVGL